MRTSKKNQGSSDIPTSNFISTGITDEALRKIIQPADKKRFNDTIDKFLKEHDAEEKLNAQKNKVAASKQTEAITEAPASRRTRRPRIGEIQMSVPTPIAVAPTKRTVGRKPKMEAAAPVVEAPTKRRARTTNADKLAQIQAAVAAELGAASTMGAIHTAEATAKSKVNRKLKMEATAPVAEAPKNKRGRKPKLGVTPAVEVYTKRKATHQPDAVAPIAATPVKEKKKPGRKPKVEALAPVVETPKRKAGRPKKAKLESKVAMSEQIDDESPIQKTTDYGRFKFSEENRDLDLKHVQELINSITEKNLLSSNPIIVNSKMEIMDGQHRYEAAKFLETTLYFKEDNNFKPNDIARINTVNRKWQLEDYLKHFRSQGNGEYAALDNFIHQYNVNIYSAIGLLSGRTAQPNNELVSRFKDGKFVVKDYEHAIHVLTIRNDFGNYSTDFYKSKMFLNVVSKLVKDPDYSHQKMIAQIQNQSRAFVKCTTVIQYLEMLTELYNYHVRKENKVDFTKDAIVD